MSKLAGRVADKVLSALLPNIEANAILCFYDHRTCTRCATNKSRRIDWYWCTDGSWSTTDMGCDSC